MIAQERELPWVVVARSHDPRMLRDAVLVLQAVGLRSLLVQDHESVRILVAPRVAVAAREHLEAFAAENVGWPPPPESLADLGRQPWEALHYVCFLLIAFVLSKVGAFDLDWLGAGRADAGRILNGELWRCVTALTLHADPPHLAGNLVFGTLFGAILGQLIGAARAWWCGLLAGAMGNALAAALAPVGHVAVGASTAVFALLGTLVVVQEREARRRRFSRARRTVPLLMGLLFLGLFGMSEGRTDVLGHFAGFFCGAALGVWHRPGPSRPALGWLAFVLLLASWVAALLSWRPV